jgi:hypothetical protein
MSTHKATIGQFGEHEDPDSASLFYHQTVEAGINHRTKQPIYSHVFSWEFPENQRVALLYANAWRVVRVRSKFVRSFGSHLEMMHMDSGVHFYVEEKTNFCSTEVPEVARWERLLKASSEVQRLGYSREWQQRKDTHGNVFYYKRETSDFRWEQPLDALPEHRLEQCCSSTQPRSGVVEQDWFACRECTTTSLSSSVEVMDFCQACARRCHAGHKGVRFVRRGYARCRCTQLMRCEALTFSKRTTELMESAQDEAAEVARSRQRDEREPFALVYCPSTRKDGSARTSYGWQFCRVLSGRTMYRQDASKNTTDAEGDDNMSAIDEQTPEPAIGEMSEQQPTGSGAPSSPFPNCSPFDAQPNAWEIVIDPIDPPLRTGMRVLARRQNKLSWWKGRITAVAEDRRTCHVAFPDRTKEHVPMSSIEAAEKDVFFYQPATGATSWTNPANAGEMVVESAGHIQPSGEVWEYLLNNSVIRREFGVLHEYEEADTKIRFYVNSALLKSEIAVLSIQRWYRKLRGIELAAQQRQWKSEACTFEKGSAVQEKEKELAAWYVLLRRSTTIRHIVADDGKEWQEQRDSETGETFFYQYRSRTFSWERPPTTAPDVLVARKFELQIGERVFMRLAGGAQLLTEVVRIHKEGERDANPFYDVKALDPEGKVFKWVERALLQQLPKTIDELRLEQLEEKWTRQLRRVRAKQQRQEELQRSILLELARQRRSGGARAHQASDGDVNDPIKQAEGKAERAKIELEMLRRIRGSEMQSVVRVANTSAPGQAAADEVHEQIRRRRRIALLEDRARMMEEQVELQALLSTLKEKEDVLSTPRSDARRAILRFLHLAMDRQERGFVICAYGCGQWVKLGEDDAEHYNHTCRRRFVRCRLGCDVTLREEEWLDQVTHQQTGTAVAWRELHEIHECACRLTPCTAKCGEWVFIRDLEHHLEALCVKRKCKPIGCRLGCKATFGGEFSLVVQAEEDRIWHERESCPMRTVRCTWTGCSAMVTAKDRNAHRDMHLQALGISVYTVPGTYSYVVPKRVNTLKVQLWGAGGGSGCFKVRDTLAVSVFRAPHTQGNDNSFRAGAKSWQRWRRGVCGNDPICDTR